MEKCEKSIRLGSLAVLCIALAVMLVFPQLWQMKSAPQQKEAQRQLVTVWMYDDELKLSSWVKKQAQEFQKKHAGVSVWVRTVTKADLKLLEEDFEHAAPDLLLFMAGAAVEESWFSQPCAPLAMAGYALVKKSEKTSTIAPTSLFGATPAPERAAIGTPVPAGDWPGQIAADDNLGAYYLQLIGAPAGATLMPKEQVQSTFFQGETAAALLDTRQIRALQAQGKGMELLRAVPGSELVLYGAPLKTGAAMAEQLLTHLQSEQAQRALAENGLFSPEDITLYGAATPILQAVEAALKEGWQPGGVSWQREREEYMHAAQALYAAQ